ncbi:hypothetical protein D3C85_1637710 [compost metagenome]
MVQRVGIPDQNCCQADQAMKDRNQLRHLSHFDFFCQIPADTPACDHAADQEVLIMGDQAEDGDGHRQARTQHPVKVAPTRTFLMA